MKTKIIRSTLLVGAIFNFMAAIMLAFTTSLGKMAGLPEPGSVFYPYLLSFIVGTFGVVYGWLAFQKVISRHLLTISAVGKFGVFLVSLFCWQTDVISFRAFSIAIGDLIFGIIFSWWLLSIKNYDLVKCMRDYEPMTKQQLSEH